MRWPVFAIFAYLALALDVGLRTLLTDPFGFPVGQPSFLLILMVYICISVPTLTALWCALILGLLVDLSVDLFFSDPTASTRLLGPAGLGYLAGAHAVLQLRAMVFRQSPLAIAVLVLAAGIFVHLVIVVLITLRGIPWLHSTPVSDWSAADQLVHRFFSLLYTVALAIPVGALLHRFEPIWGFAQMHRGRRLR